MPHSSPGSCSGQTGCAGCTSVSSGCGFCVVPSVGCVDVQGLSRCGTSEVIVTGCGGTITSSTAATVSASLAIIRGIAIVAAIIVACCGFCFRDRLRACCCSGSARRSRRSAENAIVQQNPYGSPPPPGVAPFTQSHVVPGYASYAQPQQQQSGYASYTQPQQLGDASYAQRESQQAQAVAPSYSPKQQPPPLRGPEPFALVAAVTPDSPADAAGLRVGDAIVSLCGARDFASIGSCLKAAETLGAAPPSQILRSGVIIALFIKPRKGADLGAVIEEV